MKQILLLLALAAMPAYSLFAQSFALQDFVEKYRRDKDFSYAFLSKDMFEVAVTSSVEDQDWKKLQQVVRNIGSLTVLAAKDISNSQNLYKEALHSMPVEVFDELLAVQDGKDRVKIWVKEDNGILSDLVLLVGTTTDFVLVNFTGALELNNITELAGLLDATEIEHLAKTSQLVAPAFNISPNPSSGDFNLEFQETGDQAAQLSVLDQSGRLLTTLKLSGAAVETVSITNLPAGIYWVQVKSAQGKVGAKQLQVVR